jgi:hypothetical protein
MRRGPCLAAAGVPGATLVTMRHVKLDYDSFNPWPVAEWVKWMIV